MKISTLLFLFVLGTGAFAQSAERQVIGTTGGFAQSTNVSTSFSVGETIIQTASSGTIILTQGFEQSDKNNVGINDLEAQIQLNAYPNPTAETVFVDIKSMGNTAYAVWVVDAMGKTVSVPMIQNHDQSQLVYQLDVSQLAAANYFVAVKNEQTQIIKTIQLQKIN